MGYFHRVYKAINQHKTFWAWAWRTGLVWLGTRWNLSNKQNAQNACASGSVLAVDVFGRPVACGGAQNVQPPDPSQESKAETFTRPGQTGLIEQIFRDDPDPVLIDPEKGNRFSTHPRPKIHRIVHSSQIDHQLVVPRCDELAMGGVSPEKLWILHLELKDIAMSPA